jgi:glucokinase
MEPSGQPLADVARLRDDALRLLSEQGASLADLASAGLSLPGPLDLERGLVIRPPNLPGWDEVPVRDALAHDLGCPVRIENDANAGALAEWRFGAGRGLASIVYLTMSTGVGGGLVLDGRIYRGIECAAGEVGHMPVEWDGEVCACGQRGCLEAYVGGAAWAKRLQREAPDESLAVEQAGGRDRVRPEHVVDAARRGDAFARAEIDRYIHYLSRGIVSIAFTLAPEAVILGTIPVAMGEALCFAPLREQVRALVWSQVGARMQILPAALGEDLPYLAGLSVALDSSQSLTEEQ